jgi:hypothetical protein
MLVALASPCAANRIGPICSQCSVGFVDTFGGLCIPCSEAGGRAGQGLLTAFLTLLIIAVTVAIYWLLLRMDRPLIEYAARYELHRLNENLIFLRLSEMNKFFNCHLPSMFNRSFRMICSGVQN